MQKGTKRILGLFLLMFVVLTTATAFAYWAGIVNAPSDEQATGNIEVGVGEDVNTVIEVTPAEDDGVLVPAGRATVGQVEVLTYTFEVTWTDEVEGDASHGALGTLNVTANANHTLLNAIVSGDGSITAGVPVTITVTVTLTEPANAAEYEEVAGNNFTLTIEFSVELTSTP